MRPGSGPTEDELDDIMEAEVLETDEGVLCFRDDYEGDLRVRRYRRDEFETAP